jgi:hypothetical protein
MLTPQYIVRTIAAGASTPRIAVYGRHLLIASISASTIRLSVDNDSPEQVLPRQHIDCEDRRYSSLTLFNVGAAPSTVALIVSETRVDLESDDSQFSAMAASLADIDTNVKPFANHLRIPQTTIAQIGAAPPFTQIVTAAATTREVEIVCGSGNAGYIYLACANDVTDVKSFTELAAGAAWNRKTRLPVFACSTNGNETVRGSLWW